LLLCKAIVIERKFTLFQASSKTKNLFSLFPPPQPPLLNAFLKIKIHKYINFLYTKYIKDFFVEIRGLKKKKKKTKKIILKFLKKKILTHKKF
jgi:hypothetical protein